MFLASYADARALARIPSVAAPLAERFGLVRSCTVARASAPGPDGIAAALAAIMTTPNGKNPKSYDDIVRQTVVEPDSSARPTRGQEQRAREGFRAVDGDEAALQSQVQQALAGTSGAAGVTIEIARDLVTLRGRVALAADLRAIEDRVAAVPGVGTVHNQIVVGD